MSETAYAHDFNANTTVETYTVGTGNVTAITQSTLANGVDLLVHWDDLSAQTEVRMAHLAGEVWTNASRLTGSYNSLVWLAQARYAVHLANERY